MKKQRSLHLLIAWLTIIMINPVACGSSDPETKTNLATHPTSSPDNTQNTAIPSVPDGTYNIIGPACSSTGRSPVYSDLSMVVSLHDYDHLDVRIKTIANNTWTEVYQDEDCSLTITGQIAHNTNGIYTQTKERYHSWKPEYCRLTASYSPPETGG